MIEGLNPEIESTWNQALDWFKKKGANVVEISLPHTNFSFTNVLYNGACGSFNQIWQGMTV